MNAKVSILRRIRKLIPLDIMIRLYKAFILPHFEYASPLFLRLSKGLSAKLESTNTFALRTLLNHSRLTAYEELLKMAQINSLEHRRIEQALILVTYNIDRIVRALWLVKNPCFIRVYNIDRIVRALWLVKNPCFIRVYNIDRIVRVLWLVKNPCFIRVYNIDRIVRALWLVKNPCFIRV